MLFVERFAAMLTHVGARGTVYVSVVRRDPAPGIAALALFAVIDGVAVYGTTAGWNWFDPQIARRFYGLAYVVAGLELTLAAHVRRRAGHQRAGHLDPRAGGW
jgi:hypothetical protein